jgi:glycine cleavage system regulatory protein
MAYLVLTLIGDDRAGLVAATADVINAHGGNWERSQLAELAGAFAGVVEVWVPDERAAELTASLAELDGLLKVVAQPGTSADPGAGWPELRASLVGNDRPGIVREVTGVLSRHGLNIETLNTRTVDAPMGGGRLFEADVVARIPPAVDVTLLRADLERLAGEILVDITLSESD